MNTSIYQLVAQLIVLGVWQGPCTESYVIPPSTGYHAPGAGYDYCWQLYQDVFNGTYPYNKYMGPWVLMSDFIDVYMQADILEIATIVSLMYFASHCCDSVTFFPLLMLLGTSEGRKSFIASARTDKKSGRFAHPSHRHCSSSKEWGEEIG
jgi:hypothetical protein